MCRSELEEVASVCVASKLRPCHLFGGGPDWYRQTLLCPRMEKFPVGPNRNAVVGVASPLRRSFASARTSDAAKLHPRTVFRQPGCSGKVLRKSRRRQMLLRLALPHSTEHLFVMRRWFPFRCWAVSCPTSMTRIADSPSSHPLPTSPLEKVCDDSRR